MIGAVIFVIRLTCDEMYKHIIFFKLHKRLISEQIQIKTKGYIKNKNIQNSLDSISWKLIQDDSLFINLILVHIFPYYICTFPCITFAERSTRQAVLATTAPSCATCFTCTFGEFNYSSRSGEIETPHRNIDSFL